MSTSIQILLMIIAFAIIFAVVVAVVVKIALYLFRTVEHFIDTHH